MKNLGQKLTLSALFIAITLTPALASNSDDEKTGSWDITKDSRKNETFVNNELVKVRKDSRFYYEIGGTKPVSHVPSHVSKITLGGKFNFGLGYSCGQFDPQTGFKNFFNRIKNKVEDGMNMVAEGASAQVYALPAVILARNAPDVYNFTQTNTARAEEKFRFNMMSCQEIERAAAEGKNPYKAYMEEAQTTALSEEAESNPDINDAFDDVMENGAESGIPFPVPDKGITKVGGKNQPPIKVMTSAATVGYNSQIGRTSNITTTAKPTLTSQKDSTIVSTFESPKMMSDWIVATVGEQDIRTNGKSGKTVAGKGLMSQASKSEKSISKLLTKMIHDPEEETPENYRALSSGTLVITPELINAIRTHPQAEMLRDRLSGEIALHHEVNKALVARRALIVAKSEKNISASGAAIKDINEKIGLLERDIESSLFEVRIQKELVAGTAKTAFDKPRRAIQPRPKNNEAFKNLNKLK